MKEGSGIYKFISTLSRLNFGALDIEELKKYLKMGLIFALIIGVYWTLKPLKDALFMQLVGYMHLPTIKIMAVPALIPLVMFYSKLLEHTPREKLLVIVPAIFGLSIFACGILMMFFQDAAWLESSGLSFLKKGSKSFACLWYLLVESFGSLMIALFWSFAADSSDPESSGSGFGVIAAVGQLGGILCPFFIGCLPHRLGLKTDSLTAIFLSLLILLIIPIAKNIFDETPERVIEGYNARKSKEKEPEEPGMFEGLKLIFKHKYLVGIFAVGFIYELFTTLFDYNFKINAAEQFSGTALTNYLNIYGSSVNLVSLILLLLGVTRLSNRWGIIFTLTIVPAVAAIAIFSFLGINLLTVLFSLMIATKSLNYSLNTPALKRLFIPTFKDTRYKAQAWIETFAPRASNQVGNGINTLFGKFEGSFGGNGKSYFLYLSLAIALPLIFTWIKTSRFLGKSYSRAIKQKVKLC